MTTRTFLYKRLEDLQFFYKMNFRTGYQRYVTRKLGRTAFDALKASSRRDGTFSLRTIDKLEQHAAELGFRTMLSSETDTIEKPSIRCPACQTRLCVNLSLPRLDMGQIKPADQTPIKSAGEVLAQSDGRPEKLCIPHQHKLPQQSVDACKIAKLYRDIVDKDA